MLNPSMSVACLWTKVVNLEIVTMQPHLAFQLQNLTSA